MGIVNIKVDFKLEINCNDVLVLVHCAIVACILNRNSWKQGETTTNYIQPVIDKSEGKRAEGAKGTYYTTCYMTQTKRHSKTQI